MISVSGVHTAPLYARAGWDFFTPRSNTTCRDLKHPLFFFFAASKASFFRALALREALPLSNPSPFPPSQRTKRTIGTTLARLCPVACAMSAQREWFMRQVHIFAAMLALVAFGCGKSSDTQRLNLTGSSTIAPLALELGKKFEASHPHVRIDVQTGGSSRGVADARGGLADIGMVSRALKEGEKDLKAFTIARDGISVILHKDNPVQNLTRAQVIQIYTGEITNWKDLGGADATISVVNKAEGRSTLELFLQHFKLKNAQIKASVVIGDNEQGVKTVSGNPHSIGYVSIGTANHDAIHGVPIRLVPLDGASPTLESVQKGTFPLARPLNLVTREEPRGIAREFIDFARSEGVHEIIESQYFVPLAK